MIFKVPLLYKMITTYDFSAEDGIRLGPLWPAHCEGCRPAWAGLPDTRAQRVLPNKSAWGAAAQAPLKQSQASVFNFPTGSLYQ